MTAIHNDHSAFARRYAGAYIESVDQNNLAAARAEIKSFLSLIDESADLRNVIENPLFSTENKKSVLNEIAKKAKLSNTLHHFMLTVHGNGRLAQLPKILRAILHEIDKSEGAINATVETAYPLEKAQEAKLAKEIGALSGGKANMTVTVNPDLIGGLVITLGSQRYDGSVKRRLELLAQQMRSGASEQTNTEQKEAKKA